MNNYGGGPQIRDSSRGSKGKGRFSMGKKEERGMDLCSDLAGATSGGQSRRGDPTIIGKRERLRKKMWSVNALGSGSAERDGGNEKEVGGTVKLCPPRQGRSALQWTGCEGSKVSRNGPLGENLQKRATKKKKKGVEGRVHLREVLPSAGCGETGPSEEDQGGGPNPLQ